MVGGLACTQNTGEELGTDQARISEGECLAENGTWANGECTLNGGGMGDVEIHPDDDEVCMPGDCSCDPHQVGCGDDGTGGGGGGGGDDNGGGGGSGGGGGDEHPSVCGDLYFGDRNGYSDLSRLDAYENLDTLARGLCEGTNEQTPSGFCYTSSHRIYDLFCTDTGDTDPQTPAKRYRCNASIHCRRRLGS
jgi:hypothetical protein